LNFPFGERIEIRANSTFHILSPFVGVDMQLVRLAGADFFERKVLLTGCWFVLREKYCWLVAHKSNEQGNG
jgi:hypothetical protein